MNHDSLIKKRQVNHKKGQVKERRDRLQGEAAAVQARSNRRGGGSAGGAAPGFCVTAGRKSGGSSCRRAVQQRRVILLRLKSSVHFWPGTLSVTTMSVSLTERNITLLV